MGRRSSICVGDKFGRLTVVKKTKFKYFNSSVYECTCDCGNKVVVSSGALSSGNMVLFRRDRFSQHNTAPAFGTASDDGRDQPQVIPAVFDAACGFPREKRAVDVDVKY